MHRPDGISSIAVEAIYDTSREVVPHEMLWEALQNAFAADGHLALVAQSRADALVRAHLRNAAVTPAGSAILNGPQKEPTPALSQDGPPPDPTRFKKLNEAGQFRDQAAVEQTVDVEVWNLRTRALMMRHTYALAGTFRAVHATGGATPVTTRSNDFLRFEESEAARYKKLSDEIAQRVVTDLLVQ